MRRSGSLSLVVGVLGKISLDIILMAQTEVGEVTEPADGGGSSTLPHKRNPILSVIAAANSRRVQALAQTLYGAMAGEHERAAGAWHAEWEALSDALAPDGRRRGRRARDDRGVGGPSRKDAAEPGRNGGDACGRERYDGRRRSPRAPGGPRARGGGCGPQMVAGRSAMSFWRSRPCANSSRQRRSMPPSTRRATWVRWESSSTARWPSTARGLS